MENTVHKPYKTNDMKKENTWISVTNTWIGTQTHLQDLDFNVENHKWNHL